MEGMIHVVDRTSTNRIWYLVPGYPLFLQWDGFCGEPQKWYVHAGLDGLWCSRCVSKPSVYCLSALNKIMDLGTAISQ